jgi:hypothetical protein
MARCSTHDMLEHPTNRPKHLGIQCCSSIGVLRETAMLVGQNGWRYGFLFIVSTSFASSQEKRSVNSLGQAWSYALMARCSTHDMLEHPTNRPKHLGIPRDAHSTSCQ